MSMSHPAVSGLGENCYFCSMTMSIKALASGNGWRVSEFCCSAGPDDPVFEEQHDGICIAAVVDGTFRYRTRQGRAVLAPGALLLGNQGACFECGHDHGVGDRCISFHFEPGYFEQILSAVPGARKLDFDAPRLAPHPSTLALIVEAEQPAQAPACLEEIVLELAVAPALASVNVGRHDRPPADRSARRMGEMIRFIETRICEPLSLADL